MMYRLTRRVGTDVYMLCADDCHRGEDCSFCGEHDILLNRLAAYEDTGLTPGQVKTATRIAERIATADYPHNFQRERRDIVDYMNWISDVMRDAKAWWNGRIKDKGET